jgi:hypothetical protein
MQRNFNWSLGRVIDVKDRKLIIEYFTSTHVKLVITRSPRQVSVIHKVDDLPVNTVDYYEKHIVST